MFTFTLPMSDGQGDLAVDFVVLHTRNDHLDGATVAEGNFISTHPDVFWKDTPVTCQVGNPTQADRLLNSLEISRGDYHAHTAWQVALATSHPIFTKPPIGSISQFERERAMHRYRDGVDSEDQTECRAIYGEWANVLDAAKAYLLEVSKNA